MGNTGSLLRRAAFGVALGGKCLLALVIAVSLAGAPALAQKAPAKKGTAAKAAGKNTGAWVKLCRKTKIRELDKDKKVVVVERNICRIQSERARVLVNARGEAGLYTMYKVAISQIKEKNIITMSIEVPLGMALLPGLPAAVVDKPQWLKIQKKEKVDVSKNKGLRLPYLVCKRTSCNAELKIKPELIADMKKGAGLLVQPIDVLRGPIAILIPLIGFTAAYDGPATDFKKFTDGKKQYYRQEIIRAQKEFAAKVAAAAAVRSQAAATTPVKKKPAPKK